MAIYAVGDVQGCFTELERLLDKLKFKPGKDEIWFVGDLVNRGPRSLDVLRLVHGLGKSAVVTLGNHDLHLLALALTDKAPVGDDSLAEVLEAPDASRLLKWLRRRPLAHYRPDLNTLMVHAGVARDWDALQTVKLAREVQDRLKGDGCSDFLASMYGQRPDTWSPKLKGKERLRFIINCLTRIRFCYKDGRLEFDQKGPPENAPKGLRPWFELSDRGTASVRVVFGHWSALGLLEKRNLIGLDTGCVWGGRLTAVRIDGPVRFTSVRSKGYRKL